MLRDFKDIRFRADSNIDPETSTKVLVTAALILGSHHVKLRKNSVVVIVMVVVVVVAIEALLAVVRM